MVQVRDGVIGADWTPFGLSLPVGTKLYPRPAVATPAEVTDLQAALRGMLADYEADHGEGACDCRPEAENVGHTCNACLARAALAAEPSAVGVPIRKLLRALVDAAWNEATESSHVPSTEWADRIINRVFATAPEPTHD